MRNIKTNITGNILTITVDLSIPGETSSSGKSLVIASTEGNVSVEGKPEVKMGVNIYTKKSA
jgi:hypothetical protein